MKRILVVEDDSDIARSLHHNLDRPGEFAVDVVGTGEEALARAREGRADLVLLDLGLPDRDGLEVCRMLRQDAATREIPILMLTARVEEADRVRGLELGADDYIVKPFSPREVLARVRAVLRRAGADLETVIVHGPLRADRTQRRVWVDGREVELTRREFDLLWELLRARGRVLPRPWLLERVWGYERPGTTRTVDVHVRHLRQKLGGRAAELIETVIGVGYRLAGAA